jgi:hypothetical protein
MAFVSGHLSDPNFGLLTDMVSLLQKIQTRISTNESVISEHYKAGQVKLDKIEAGVIASYLVTMPNVFNRSTEDILPIVTQPSDPTVQDIQGVVVAEQRFAGENCKGIGQ